MSQINWLKSTNEERAMLYPVAKAIKDTLRLPDWNAFFAMSLVKRRRYSDGYGSLFQRGSISKKNAADIYNWIAANHPKIGHRLAANLFPHSSQTAWDDFITQRGKYGLLKTINPQSLFLTQRDEDFPVEEDPIPLNRAYCFALIAAPEGFLLIFESHEGGPWHPVAIGETNYDLVAHTKANHCLVPWNLSEGRPVKLRERKDRGLRCFVALHGSATSIRKIENKLLAGQPIHESTLNAIADYCMEFQGDELRAHRLNVVFG